MDRRDPQVLRVLQDRQALRVLEQQDQQALPVLRVDPLDLRDRQELQVPLVDP